jgi:hypothetical protein
VSLGRGDRGSSRFGGLMELKILSDKQIEEAKIIGERKPEKV